MALPNLVDGRAIAENIHADTAQPVAHLKSKGLQPGRDLVRAGAVVVDVGGNRVPDPAAQSGTRLVGAVDFASAQRIAGRINPNPGGVGPMTIAMLMQNTVRAAAQPTR